MADDERARKPELEFLDHFTDDTREKAKPWEVVLLCALGAAMLAAVLIALAVTVLR